jgi:hypothetical protein
MKRLTQSLFIAVALLAPQPAHADLIDLKNGMIYDTVQNLTWLQDPLYARTSGAHPTGQMTYAEGVAWTADLVFGGFDDWRMPQFFVHRRPESPCRCGGDSEITRLVEQLGWHWDMSLTDYISGSRGPFLSTPVSMITPGRWWSPIVDVDGADGAIPRAAAWAVRDGNPLARVPEPSTLLMLGIGVAVFGARNGSRRRLS